MKSIKQTEEFIGRIYEGGNGMIISTNEGYLINIGEKISQIVEKFDGKKAKIVLTIKIQEFYEE